MDAVIIAAIAGIVFGALAVFVKLGLRRAPDAVAGGFVMNVSALLIPLVAIAAGVPTGRFDAGELWPFLLIGALSPGLVTILYVQAIQYAGASRTGVLLGVAPILSAVLAIVFLDEAVQASLLIATVMVVVGGMALAWERERPPDFRMLGAGLALGGAVILGARDNLVRWGTGEAAAEPIVEVAVTLVGASATVFTYMLITGGSTGPVARVRGVLSTFIPIGVFGSIGSILLLEAFDRGEVTVVAPLIATHALWGVVFSALMIRRSELIGGRLVLASLLVVGGGILIGVTRSSI
jgi:drug/metabolite transporter (DMT)-like permease